MQLIPASQRHYQDFGWLKTNWLFSFDSYHDPSNMHWGKLRVFNDDIVLPGRGFEMHPHREMEIISIILRGEISHLDSMGNEMTVRAGEIQRMTAGTGITHAEKNLGSEDLELFQIWLFPNEKGLEPEYEQTSFADLLRPNNVTPLVTGLNPGGLLSMHADGNVSMIKLGSGSSISVTPVEEGKQFFYLIDGLVTINGRELNPRDQLRSKESDPISVEAIKDSDMILIESL